MIPDTNKLKKASFWPLTIVTLVCTLSHSTLADTKEELLLQTPEGRYQLISKLIKRNGQFFLTLPNRRIEGVFTHNREIKGFTRKAIYHAEISGSGRVFLSFDTEGRGLIEVILEDQHYYLAEEHPGEFSFISEARLEAEKNLRVLLVNHRQLAIILGTDQYSYSFVEGNRISSISRPDLIEIEKDYTLKTLRAGNYLYGLTGKEEFVFRNVTGGRVQAVRYNQIINGITVHPDIVIALETESGEIRRINGTLAPTDIDRQSRQCKTKDDATFVAQEALKAELEQTHLDNLEVNETKLHYVWTKEGSLRLSWLVDIGGTYRIWVDDETGIAKVGVLISHYQYKNNRPRDRVPDTYKVAC